MKRFKTFGKRILGLIIHKDVFFNASAITFNILLCAIPFTLILISITGYLLSIDQAYHEVIRYGQELLPRIIHEKQALDSAVAVSLNDLLDPLIQKRRIYGIVGISVLIVFSLALFTTVKHVIFQIFDIKDRKHFAIEYLYSFLAMGIVGGVFVFFSIVIAVLSLIPLNEVTLPLGSLVLEFNWLYNLINLLIPLLFTFILFYAIFRYLSERRVPRKVALIGASVYTILFEAAKIIISLYLDRAFEAYQYLYQGYSIIVLLGIWTFYSALLLVISAIIARAYQDTYLYKQPVQENPYDIIS